MKKLSLLLLAALTAFFVACEDDDKPIKNSEANLLAITLDSEYIISQPTIGNSNVLTVLIVKDSEEKLKAVPFTIEISEGATLSPDLGTTIDLSQGSAKIVITAEDDVIVKTYTITTSSKMLFDFEEWVTEFTEDGIDFLAPGPIDYWGTSNQGSLMAAGMAGIKETEDKLAVIQSAKEDAYEGNTAAILRTLDTKPTSSFLVGLVPRVTSGSLFLGNFKLDFTDQLQSTKFGIPFGRNPLQVTGFYKYTSGDQYYEFKAGDKKGNPTPIEGKKDEGLIGAILYEISSDEDAYVTGKDTYTNERIVAMSKKVIVETKNYQEFTLDLKMVEGKKYDKSKQYRFAIIASSSIDGDKFSGAPGSTLYLDNIEIVSE